MAKLKKYTLADLMQDRKKAQQRAMSSMGDVYKFDTNGHLVDEPVEENNTPYDTFWIGNKSYMVQSKLVVSSYDFSYQGEDGFTKYGQGIAVRGGDGGLFMFLAQNSEVEWGVQYHSTDGKLFDNTNCAINTSHHEGKCIAQFDASEMTANNYNTFTHSHPSNELQSASQDDRDFLSALFNGEIDNAFYSSIIDYWGVYDRFRNKVKLYQDEVY